MDLKSSSTLVESGDFENNDQLYIVPEITNHRPTQAHRILQNCNILHRNLKACISASASSQNPADRIRHNDPYLPTPVRPTRKHLGYHTKNLAKTVRNMAIELNTLSDLLIRDPDMSLESRERARRLVQNNMDAARYMYPYLKNFTKISVPLGQSNELNVCA